MLIRFNGSMKNMQTLQIWKQFFQRHENELTRWYDMFWLNQASAFYMRHTIVNIVEEKETEGTRANQKSTPCECDVTRFKYAI